ncbi:Purple acid phosphatase [Balamuthia mandrillaris]
MAALRLVKAPCDFSKSLSLLLLLLVIALGVAKGNSYPRQVHLSLGGKPGEVFVQWITWNATKEARVRYGTEQGALGLTTTGRTTRYNTTGWPGFVHTVKLSGLLADTTYYYRCGDNTSQLFSSLYSFRTLPTNGQPVNIAIFGDMGLDYESDRTVAVLSQAVSKGYYHFVVHMGDIAYTYSDGLTNQTRFDLYMDKIEPIAANSPYMVSAGNQEHPFLFQEYIYRWQMPYETSNSANNLWYSFDIRNMNNRTLSHFVAVSTEHKLDPGSPQYEWLVADLSALRSSCEDGSTQPWVILFGHRPLYCSNSPYDNSWFADCYVVAPGLRKLLEPLFKQFGVDLYLAGHMHNAEYTYPVYNSRVTSLSWHNAPSTIHLISGYAGCREGFNGFDESIKPDWSAWRQDTHFGFSNMTIFNHTHLSFTYLYADNSSFQKEVWITKDQNAFSSCRRGHHHGKPLGLNTMQLYEWKVDKKGRLDDGNLALFMKGFGIGLGMQFGSIPSCIADSYPVTYMFSLAFQLLEQGFSSGDMVELIKGLRTLSAALLELLELVQDCGGTRGISDFLKLVKELKQFGIGHTLEEEALKVAYHFQDLKEALQQATQYWQKGYYEQCGVYVGQVVALLIAPLPPNPR